MQSLSLCRGPYTEKHLRFFPDFFLIWPRSRYCGKIRGRVRLAEATTWSGATGYRWSPAGLFFYSTKEATDITRKHIVRRHGHARE